MVFNKFLQKVMIAVSRNGAREQVYATPSHTCQSLVKGCIGRGPSVRTVKMDLVVTSQLS